MLICPLESEISVCAEQLLWRELAEGLLLSTYLKKRGEDELGI
jgi:hypothetical protein